MERIVIAMQRRRGGCAACGGASREANLILSCRRTSIMGPRQGGLFGFKFSSRPHPRKFAVKRFLVLREALAGKWAGLFLGYLLGKNFSAAARPREWSEPPWPHLAIHAAEHEFPRLRGLTSG